MREAADVRVGVLWLAIAVGVGSAVWGVVQGRAIVAATWILLTCAGLFTVWRTSRR